MPIRKKLDIPMNVLVTAPVKIALQRLADENMVSVSDIVRAAINAAVPVQFENYQKYLLEATNQLDSEDTLKKIDTAFNTAQKIIERR